MRKMSYSGTVSLIIGYAFLYLPILFLIIFSFNESRLPGVWVGFSTKWYHLLFDNEELLAAVLTSFQIASMSATSAMILGTLAAVSMVRFGFFRGRTLFSGMISAPLVMPEVITGLALLLMCVTFERLIGWPSERGMMTVTIAHTTLAMAYVYLIVQARLQDFDRSLEEAAQDLGAKPIVVFFKITLPLIAPSLLAGWLLAFALSLDDVVLASFLSGPGATTLPILIFSSLRLGITPEINALAAIVVGIVSIGVTIAGFVMVRKKR
ncbi:MAG: ABC transporter permease subunit [Alphaproteobacteria bacterium]|jgi:putrescine transport system permease protein|nr:ABC transporter permease subunit [Alphaproteobacteria bacterium]